ncbi:PB1 domain containing protein [Senna tora]|uniref:PB1 domain containing protein n=1 Tax=Senna tora TaxID=362788 RepID=A0A834TWY6_9FABA|nr:PB1 domain containing protein [Senna tora]
MDNHHSHSSVPDSRHNSNEVDNENPSFDVESLSTTINNHKVKLMCSYGGNVQFRAHDNQLAYVGGDTKIITIDRNIKFSSIMAKLSSLCNADVFFKYQLPGEDLDVLISVTNDEDLEHMMVEYDQSTQRASAKPARLRLFLFTPTKASAPTSFGSNNLKPEQQWFVDALNSVHIPRVERSSPSVPVSAGNPDFLFGLDNRYSVVPPPNLPHENSVPLLPPASSTVPHLVAKDSSAVIIDGGSEERQVVGEPAVSTPGEVQLQIQELQISHLGNNEQILQRENDEGNGKVNNNNTSTIDVAYSSQKIPEKAPLQPPSPLPPPPANSVPAPAPSMQLPMVYLPERQMASAGYNNSSATVSTDHQQQPLYLIATPTVMYHATTIRPVNGQIGQPYYGVPRMVTAAEFYNGAPVQASLSHSHNNSQSTINNGANHFETTNGTVLQSKVGVGVAEPAGYTRVAFDNTGRQVYITAPAWSGVVPPYGQEVVAGSDAKLQGAGGGAVNQDNGKVSKAAAALKDSELFCY